MIMLLIQDLLKDLNKNYNIDEFKFYKDDYQIYIQHIIKVF